MPVIILGRRGPGVPARPRAGEHARRLLGRNVPGPQGGPPDSSGIVAILDEVWVAQVEKALAKAEKIDKEQVDRESVEKAKEAASAAS